MADKPPGNVADEVWMIPEDFHPFGTSIIPASVVTEWDQAPATERTWVAPPTAIDKSLSSYTASVLATSIVAASIAPASDQAAKAIRTTFTPCGAVHKSLPSSTPSAVAASILPASIVAPCDQAPAAKRTCTMPPATDDNSSSLPTPSGTSTNGAPASFAVATFSAGASLAWSKQSSKSDTKLGQIKEKLELMKRSPGGTEKEAICSGSYSIHEEPYATYAQLNYMDRIKRFLYQRKDFLPIEKEKLKTCWKEPQLKHTPLNELTDPCPEDREASNCIIKKNYIVLDCCNIVNQIIRVAELKLQKEEKTNQHLTKDLLLLHTHLEKLKFLVDYSRKVRHHRKQMEDFDIWDESGAVRVHFLDESQVKHSQAVVDRDGKLVYLMKSEENLQSINPNYQLPSELQPPFYPWDMRDIDFS